MFTPKSELLMKEESDPNVKKQTQPTLLLVKTNSELHLYSAHLAFEWQSASFPAVTGSRPSSSCQRAEIDVF